jgi:hypothetical protein
MNKLRICEECEAVLEHIAGEEWECPCCHTIYIIKETYEQID